MASIRETVETMFTASAFAERDCTQEALECLASAPNESKRTKVLLVTVGKDSRPRVRV